MSVKEQEAHDQAIIIGKDDRTEFRTSSGVQHVTQHERVDPSGGQKGGPRQPSAQVLTENGISRNGPIIKPTYAAMAKSSPFDRGKRESFSRQQFRGYNVSRDRFLHSFNGLRSRVICYRCGDAGHLARDCRNAKTCFNCGRIGHIASFCRARTLIPNSYTAKETITFQKQSSALNQFLPSALPKTSKPMASRVMRFMETEASARLEAQATRGVISESADRINQHNLIAALSFCFPYQGHKWSATSLGGNRYRINAPDLWKQQNLAKGVLTMGDVRVKVYETKNVVNQGFDPVRVWIKIKGMPEGLRSRDALSYLVQEFGTLIESVTPVEEEWCRVMVELPHVEVIPEYQWLEYIKRTGIKKTARVTFEYESDVVDWDPRFPNKRSRTYWRQQEEPAPKSGSGPGITKPHEKSTGNQDRTGSTSSQTGNTSEKKKGKYDNKTVEENKVSETSLDGLPKDWDAWGTNDRVLDKIDESMEVLTDGKVIVHNVTSVDYEDVQRKDKEVIAVGGEVQPEKTNTSLKKAITTTKAGIQMRKETRTKGMESQAEHMYKEEVIMVFEESAN